jgi:predicted TIM-barrel fold metal-dependent hydrolase
VSAAASPSSAEVRREVGHPIVDADGHVLELLPAVFPYLRETLGSRGFERYLQQIPATRRARPPRPAREMLADRAPQTAWFGAVTESSADRATVMFPELLCERMQELGIDFSVLFTTHALSSCGIADEELRRGTIRAFNRYYADVYGPHRDRLAIAGIIPMHTPREAIEELEHCASLGLKVAAFPEGVLRPIATGTSARPLLWPGQTHWIDRYGLDSAHDYDPVWSRARELGFAVLFHGALGIIPGEQTSPTSYVYNHVGMFARVSAPVARSLFMGGVTRRFPELPFAFLECGVSWGAQMLVDLVEHWERRNIDALHVLDPANLRPAEVARYFERYGGVLRERLEGGFEEALLSMPIDTAAPEEKDEWRALGVSGVDELVEAFASSFYFGCEADDRGIVTAFPPMPPRGASLRPLFSSDMGHWDVTDLESVVSGAHGLLREGLISTDQFRAFTFENPVRLLTAVAPDFFSGTLLEKQASELQTTLS